MPYKPDYSYIPPMNKDWLTSWYDCICTITGFGRRFKMKVLDLSSIKDGDTIVDVGCGTGMFLALAKEKYPRAHLIGVDPDKKALAIARHRLTKNGGSVELHDAYAESIPLQSASADVCVSSLAFHHMPDEVKEKAAEEIFRILKPGGRVIIADFGKGGNWLLRKVLGLFENVEYLKGNFQGLIPVYLEKAGFKNIKLLSAYLWGVHIISAQK